MKLRRLDGWNEDRRRTRRDASRGPRRLRASSSPSPPVALADHVYHLFIVRTERREALRAFLDERGVSTAVHYPFPIHRTEAYAELGLGEGSLPVAERLAEQICTLPLFPSMSDDEVAQRHRGRRRTSTRRRHDPKAVPPRLVSADRSKASAADRRRRLRLLGPEPRAQRDRAPRARAGCAVRARRRRAAPRSRSRCRACRCTPTSTPSSTDPAIDAVVVATPPRTHYAIVGAALGAGKHVLVEKPLARTAAEAASWSTLAERARPGADAGHTFLYSPPVNKVYDLIRQGSLGEVYFVTSSRMNLGKYQPDGVICDLAPHDISILLYLLGSRSRR